MIPLHRKLSTDPMRLLVRHADAGDRRTWSGPDEWRGLSGRGRVQAERLLVRLGGLPILRVLTSPSLRCRQTVVPLARELFLEVEPCRLLAPEADPARLARFLRDPDTCNAVLCTHRETLLGLFTLYAAEGVRFIDGIAPMQMAASWAMYGGEHTPPRLRYMRPRPVSVVGG